MVEVLVIRICVLGLALASSLTASAQLTVTILPTTMASTKAIVPLALRNDFTQKVEGVRAVMFLLDDRGKVVGQATRWIVGGDRQHPPLEVGATNTFHFVV